ncbi:cordon-bleu protein-like 1b isoform X3 [Melanotaenia boesemani]|uniref:cordon-bleu protein-like 1b isoform X3 n=1 Tax=Melanotaenia boesemani TaxID=1250792 RepID=UPI001C05E61D|nr:cordon-bleu protein-like 1b isoform X3 [Melanotaenia boesemani]
MEVDNCFKNQLHSLVSTKSKAPSPPGLDPPGFSQWHPENPHLSMDQKENILDKELSMTVVLPGGVEKMTVVHGSKPVMDLLVTLCAQYHLNPSSHTLELVTANRNNIKLKPNALIGTLDAEKILLKPKGEDKNKKTGPQMPEATVRMVINYKKTQKTILRVNPRVPLSELLPAICEKCEFDTETTVLLRDVQSPAPLDLSSSLNDYAIREVYARDTKGQPASPSCPSSPTSAGAVTPGKDKNQKEKENKGLFSMFRKSKKKSEQSTTASAPASPVLVSKPRPLSMALPSSNSSPLGSPTIFADAPKKRRAPQPPIDVSQSCHSDLGTRRRINSEPNSQLDRDQITGVSRGSSAESSLKRTKRKAPPPPTSPTTAVQEPVSPDENFQVTAVANTLEEIMEQEETATVSVRSATAGSSQGEDNSLNLSPEASLHSPSPDTETESTMSMEGSGEDQSVDLSSDGNKLQSTLNDSTPAVVGETDGTDPSEQGATENGQFAVEDVLPHPIYEESIADSTEGGCSGSALPLPVTQDAEVLALVQANTETMRELTDELEGSLTTSASRPSGEDAQVQTDFIRFPVPPQEFMDKIPSSTESPAFEAVGKKDMGTLTEELEPSDLKHASSPTSETSSCQDSAPSAPVVTKVPSMYAADSEPKPKPSNELTRDYIPKVGMTTYTVVPQKSLEKLRYFEVALTLETPPEASAEGLDICSLDLEEKAGQRDQTEVSEEKELNFDSPREDFLTSTTNTTTTTTTSTTSTMKYTVNGSTPETTHSSSPTSLHSTDKLCSSVNGASQAGSPSEVKELKIPPATKPKPTPFRLAQHKKTPGYYVTSAAEKSLHSSPSSPVRETEGNVERDALPPPPHPPPVQCQEKTAGATNVQLSPKQDDKNATFMQMTRQSSLPARESSIGLSLEKLRSFTAPRPYSPTTPSRFAQAVSSAVKRSQSLSHAPKSPPFTVSPPVSPITSHSSVLESKGLSQLKDCDSREVDGDCSTLHREEVVQKSREGSP